MDDLTLKEIDDILADPDYDQQKLVDWFKAKFGTGWKNSWRRYMETGEVV